MRLVICSIYDKASESYGRPIFVAAPGQALRSFIDEVNNPKAETDLAKHPADFELYQLGYFDDATGFFTQDGNPVMIASAASVSDKT